MRSAPLVFCFLLSLPSFSSGQTPIPIGDQFQVNTYTTLSQYDGEVAVTSSGDFLVAWASSLAPVQGQQFDADGLPAGADFQINEYPRDWYADPRTALLPDGGFLVVWAEGSGSEAALEGRRFSSDGAPQAGQFTVGGWAYQDERGAHDVATAEDGSFVVVWGDANPYRIFGRFFASDGSTSAGRFQINTYTTGYPSAPAAATIPGGGFAVVWRRANDIVMGRLDALGNVVGEEVQISSSGSTTGLPRIAFGHDDEFLVTWASSVSSGDDSSGDSIQARRFTSAGRPMEPEFQVNSYVTGDQIRPDATVHPGGDFMVVWQSYGSGGTDGSGSSIQGRVIGPIGVPVGEDFQINSYTTENQRDPSLGFDDRGVFVVTWDSRGSNGSDTSFTSIQARRFVLPAVFRDRFESGDTSAWSEVQR